MHRAKEGWEEEEKEWHQPPQTVIAVIIPSPPIPPRGLAPNVHRRRGGPKKRFPYSIPSLSVLLLLFGEVRLLLQVCFSNHSPSLLLGCVHSNLPGACRKLVLKGQSDIQRWEFVVRTQNTWEKGKSMRYRHTDTCWGERTSAPISLLWLTFRHMKIKSHLIPPMTRLQRNVPKGEREKQAVKVKEVEELPPEPCYQRRVGFSSDMANKPGEEFEAQRKKVQF